jgi:hypothetical protein
MSFERHLERHSDSVTAASAVLPRQPIVLGGSSALLAIPVSTNTQFIDGVNGAASVAAGEQVTVLEDGNIVKVNCAASVGAGAEVMVASTNGAVGPLTAASGSARVALGKSRHPAAAGEVLAISVRPRQTGGLA